ncbi:MAG TPA: hypothetical protein H9902_09555 [Candidatus Stackebrandtia faecavium]|nr:hypothetical protein [Candidatus Stackebrandtia faecavium]
MNTGNPYQELDLDQIIEITASDAAHAPDLREQGKGLKLLADKLDESVNNLAVARSGVKDGFDGDAAQKMVFRATRLVVRGSEGHVAIRDQHQIFFELSVQAEVTHQRMLELREERDNKLSNAAPEEHEAIHKKYTVEARDYMRETTSGYIESLRSSERMKWYAGPRVPRDGEDGGPNGFEDHTTTGPSLGQNGPILQSGTGIISAEVQVGPSQSGTGGSTGVHNGTGVGLFGTGTAGSSRKRKKSAKGDRRQQHAGATGSSEDSPFTPRRDVVPPVIGARNSGESAGGGRARRTDGLVSPVLGGRGPMMGMGMHGMTGASQPGGGQAPRTPTPQSPKVRPPEPKSIGNSGAGTRAPARPQPVRGKAFPDGAVRRLIMPERTDFTRQPKLRHGDEDNLNRAVVRNSRALTPEPERQPRPVERSTHPQWKPEKPVVEPVIRRTDAEDYDHDPGPFLAHYNIGRNS